MARKVAKKPAKRLSPANVKKTALTSWRLVLSMAGGEQVILGFPTESEKNAALSSLACDTESFKIPFKNVYVRPTHISVIRDVGEVMVPSSQV